MRRWLAVSVFILSSTLNYLDRQLLATLAPLIMADFHFNQTRLGLLYSAFSIAYAVSSVFVGWFLDRAGINRGISTAVAWWSAAAASTGLVGGFGALAVTRAALGVGESAGVPAVGKLNGMYLKPKERAMGAALNQVGLSLGLALAPAWIVVATSRSWRTPFVVVGLMGLLWIPLWLVVSRRIPPTEPPSGSSSRPGFSLLLDRDLLLLVCANILWMGTYSLWSNWMTLYLINARGLTLRQTAGYVWLPPMVSIIGGFFGGWLSLRWMERGMRAVPARRRAIFVSALGSLSTLLVPLMPDARWATAAIAVSFFFALAGSVNIYAIPIDLYGPERSGLAISALVFGFGILQTVISPVIGYLSDLHLYTQVVWMVAAPPLVSCLFLWKIGPGATDHTYGVSGST
jgi:ACS family hexuronate transporter-like MFS transporter